MLRSNPPSADRHRRENFPVASLLLAPAHRSAVLAFYRVARAADDIADDPHLSSAEKLAQLDAIAASTQDPHLNQLLQAFRQDAVRDRYVDWPDLLAYCRLSAVPVGRFLLRLHGQPANADGPADALCIALQILNHVQDCGADWRMLGRCYLPLSDLVAEGADPADLSGDYATPALRRVLDRLLDRCAVLLSEASSLPARIQDRRLRLETVVTLDLAAALLARLCQHDPLAGRVALSRSQMALRAGWQVLRLVGGLRPVRPAASSFTAAIARVAPARRAAMAALYDYCRHIDDIADGVASSPEKLAALDDWRHRVAGGDVPDGLGGLPMAELLAVIDGVAMDVVDPPIGPSWEWLERYCDRVAGAVGRLSVRVFGSDRPQDLAVAEPLGRALQLVNILRDVHEDAARLRLYLPAPLLDRHGITGRDPVLVLRHPAIGAVCADLAQRARAEFRRADDALAQADRRCLRPAQMMRDAYGMLLDRLEHLGWPPPRGQRVRLTPWCKLRLAARFISG